MLQDNDIGLIIRANIDNKQWAGTVDLQAFVMPPKNLSQESLTDLVYMVHGLVACFNLMNSDEDFANQINAELERMHEAGEILAIETGASEGNVVHIITDETEFVFVVEKWNIKKHRRYAA